MKLNDLPELAVQTLRPLTIHLFTATAQGPTAQAAFHAALRRPAGLRAHRRGLCVRAVVMRCVQIPPAPECAFKASVARPLQPEQRRSMS